MSPDLLSVVIRALGFASIFQAGGAALYLVLFRTRLPRSTITVRRLGLYAALSGLVLVAAHQGLEAARMADEFPGLLDAHLQRMAWGGSSGSAALLSIAGLAVLALGLSLRADSGAVMASGGALIVACAFVLTGHTSLHSQRTLLAPLLALHVMLGSFWFGCLLPLIIATRCEARQDALAVLRAFSAVAGPLVPCIGVAGLVMSQTLLSEKAQWQTTYAALLLTKMAIFVLLLGLAAWNRWRALPALASGEVADEGRGLRRCIATEYGLMLGVMAVTAVMTTFYSP